LIENASKKYMAKSREGADHPDPAFDMADGP